MLVPKGARVDGDAVLVPTTPRVRLLSLVALALFAGIAILLPIDQAGEGRLVQGLVASAICLPIVAGLVWYVGWGSRAWMLRIDDAGVRSRIPGRLARWQDVRSITPPPTMRYPIVLEVPAGLVQRDGSRSRSRTMWIRPSSFAGGSQLAACLVDRWQRSRHGTT